MDSLLYCATLPGAYREASLELACSDNREELVSSIITLFLEELRGVKQNRKPDLFNLIYLQIIIKFIVLNFRSCFMLSGGFHYVRSD